MAFKVLSLQLIDHWAVTNVMYSRSFVAQIVFDRLSYNATTSVKVPERHNGKLSWCYYFYSKAHDPKLCNQTTFPPRHLMWLHMKFLTKNSDWWGLVNPLWSRVWGKWQAFRVCPIPSYRFSMTKGVQQVYSLNQSSFCRLMTTWFVL